VKDDERRFSFAAEIAMREDRHGLSHCERRARMAMPDASGV
jgi:hypothetical protein